jgi:hypothetical protein
MDIYSNAWRGNEASGNAESHPFYSKKLIFKIDLCDLQTHARWESPNSRSKTLYMCQFVDSFDRSRSTVRHRWVKSREMTSYPSTQLSTIFQHVGMLIYVFEASAHDADKDAAYYRNCLDALQKYSPEDAVFLFGHKMDLVRGGDGAPLLERRRRELQAEWSRARHRILYEHPRRGVVQATQSTDDLSRARFSLSPSRSPSHTFYSAYLD